MAGMPNSVEILAPAGKWETMTEVLAAGADAVYLGGKRFNMRAMRADFNLTDAELERAVLYCHERDKKLYVTVNNLYYQDEINALADYLAFLKTIGVDAVIAQDLAVASLVTKTVPDLPMHASVQMGIANSASANWLATHGFSRAILSKNVSKPEIAAIHQASPLEIEYFVHGDLCISHTGQCYMSAFIFGESGNRGRCKKPCRWPYKIQGKEEHPWAYYLAHKDLYLLEDLPALLAAGVVSLKIEGRMRDAVYLNRIIKAFRQVLDGLEIDSPAFQTIRDDLYANRARDFTTAGFSHRITTDDIGLSGTREPVFPTAPLPIAAKTRNSDAESISGAELQVQVAREDVLASVLAAGVKTVIIGGETVLPAGGLNLTRVSALIRKAGVNTIYQLPRVITESQIDELRQQLPMIKSAGIETVLVSDIGSMHLAQSCGLKVWGDYSLNITNAEAGALLADQGLERMTAALELREPELSEMLPQATLPVDVLVHGWLPGIVTDLCLRGAVEEGCYREQEVMPLYLVDREGNKYPVVCGQNCHQFIYYPFKLSLLGQVKLLSVLGVTGLRLDLTEYTPEQASQVIRIYQQALNRSDKDVGDLMADLARLTGIKYTDAPFQALEPGS
ncbi:MAG: peptidase U32 family protein [Methylocystaceae bacterium]